MDSNAIIQHPENNHTLDYIKLIIKAAKETHSMYASAYNKARPLRAARESGDMSEKIQVLQNFIKEYKSFIDATTRITGLCIYYLSIEDISKIDLDEQLSIMEGIVFLKEAFNSGKNLAFKNCLNKLMKKSGLFTKAQLDAFDAAMDTSKRDRWVHNL